MKGGELRFDWSTGMYVENWLVYVPINSGAMVKGSTAIILVLVNTVSESMRLVSSCDRWSSRSDIVVRHRWEEWMEIRLWIRKWRWEWDSRYRKWRLYMERGREGGVNGVRTLPEASFLVLSEIIRCDLWQSSDSSLPMIILRVRSHHIPLWKRRHLIHASNLHDRYYTTSFPSLGLYQEYTKVISTKIVRRQYQQRKTRLSLVCQHQDLP